MKFRSIKSLLSILFLCLFSFNLNGGSEAKKKIKVACVGDSITYGARVDDRSVDSYPAQLQKIYSLGISMRLQTLELAVVHLSEKRPTNRLE